MDGTDEAEICSFSVPIQLDVRHASFKRTWTEISRFEYGAMGRFSWIQRLDGVDANGRAHARSDPGSPRS